LQGNLENQTDHTYGTQIGHYMSAKFLTPHNKNRIARLQTPTIPNSLLCVSFWYKTYGDIELNLRILKAGIYDSNSLFTVRGAHGPEWSLAQVTINNATSSQISFEALDLGSEFGDGDVWLDDIEIKLKECAPLGACDFEDGLCGFSFLTSASDFEWVILNGYFGIGQNIWSVPTFDSTLNSSLGSFLYLDTNNKLKGKRALIESEIIGSYTSNQTGKCVQFFLKTNINNRATLKLNRKNKLNGDLIEMFSTNEANTQDAWVLKEVQLTEVSSGVNYPYSFVFEGIVGENESNKLGQMAIDDIKIYDGTCQIQIFSSSSAATTSSTSLTSSLTSKLTSFFSSSSSSSISSSSPSTSKSSSTTNRPNECLNYCKNGGVCSFTVNNGLACNCTNTGFEGKNCEFPIKTPKDPESNSNLFLKI
jgi:hypothetical protein